MDDRIPESEQLVLPKNFVNRPQSRSKLIAASFQTTTSCVWTTPRTKTQVISELHAGLQRSFPGCVPPESLQVVLDRESVMSTFLNEGLAVPHAALPGLDRVYWAIGIPKSGISDVETDTVTHAVLLALYPPNRSSEYLTGLGAVAAIFRDLRAIEQLKFVESPEDILDWLKANSIS